MLLVDSTVWIDYFNGRVTPETDHLDRIMPLHPILVGNLILTEVLQGFRSDAEFERARRALGKFARVSVVNPDLAVRAPGTTKGCAIGGPCSERSSTASSQPTASRQAASCSMPIKTTIHSRNILDYVRSTPYGDGECKDAWDSTQYLPPQPGSYGPGDAGEAWSGPGGCSVSWP